MGLRVPFALVPFEFNFPIKLCLRHRFLHDFSLLTVIRQYRNLSRIKNLILPAKNRLKLIGKHRVVCARFSFYFATSTHSIRLRTMGLSVIMNIRFINMQEQPDI